LTLRRLDRENGVLNVVRVYSQGRLKPCMKSDRQRRRVPLRAKVLEALDAMPPRIDTPVLFPAADGDRLKLATFRLRHWTPALKAAGIEHRSVSTCRHTFAAWSIRAGVQLFYLSRIMGTSVAQIDKTYGHLVPDSEEYLRGLSTPTTLLQQDSDSGQGGGYSMSKGRDSMRKERGLPTTPE
jgi:integrase